MGWVFAATSAALLAADVASWRRTARLRAGRPPPSHELVGAVRVRTSRATWLAGLAGVSLVAAGALGLPRGLGPAVVVMAPGAFVAVTGFAARVVALESTGRGLVIRYAARRSFFVPWSGCVELRPPRTPLGGWRVSARGGSRTLMPTDVLGHERMLAALVTGSELVFQGGAWRARPASACGGAVSPAA